MKTAVILMDGITQIVFTPETDSDKYALSFFKPESKIETLVYRGNLYSQNQAEPFTYNIKKCQGGWFRLFQDLDSRILIVENQKDTEQ